MLSRCRSSLSRPSARHLVFFNKEILGSSVVTPAPPVVAKEIIRPKWASDFEARDEAAIKGFLELSPQEQRANHDSAGAVTFAALEKVAKIYPVGSTTTLDVDMVVAKVLDSHGAYPSCLGYQAGSHPPFPRISCTSCESILLHGVPNEEPLPDGTTFNVDVTSYLGGYHGDSSIMVGVGSVSDEKRHLILATHQALHTAISVVGPGVPYKAIADAVEKVANYHGFAVDHLFAGHGVGTEFHCPPIISHTTSAYEPGVMKEGETFTIEPSLFMSDSTPGVRMNGNDWPVIADGGIVSAQWEHSLRVTKDGCELITQPRGSKDLCLKVWGEKYPLLPEHLP